MAATLRQPVQKLERLRATRHYEQGKVTSTKPRSAGPLPVENRHLMSEGQHLKFQGSPTPKPEGDQRNYRGQDRKHAGHHKTVGAKLQCFQSRRNYEQPHPTVCTRAARVRFGTMPKCSFC